MAPDVQRQIEETATKSFLDKDSLHQATAVGYGGAPQMRRWERSQFLGQFPEHVLWAAAPSAHHRPLPAAVLQALEDPRCERVVIKASLVGSTGQFWRRPNSMDCRSLLCIRPNIRMTLVW